MQHAPTTEQVAAHASAAVGRDVARVESLQGSVLNDDFRVRLVDGSSVIVKIGPQREMEAEAWACRLLLDAGVPVPEVLAVLREGLDGRAALVLAFVPGAPSEHAAVMLQAGTSFRRVHAEQLPGWGALVVDAGPVGARGQHDSWAEAVEDQLAGLPELVDAGVLEARLAALTRSRVMNCDLLAYDGPGVLLHNDLKTAHVFGQTDARGMRLSAVIDWGDASVGDPRADVARLSMAGPDVVSAFLDGYGWELTRSVAEDLARYRIMWNVDALTYEYRAGGDWFDVYRQRIVDDVQLLGRSTA